MANHFFSLNHGLADFNNNASAITQATSSTTGDDIELRLADGVGLVRRDVIVGLEKLLNFFKSGNIPGVGPTFPVQ